MDATAQIQRICGLLAGEPAFLAGSLVAEETYGLTDAHDDADIFTPTENAMTACVQKLLGEGFELDDRFTRVWQRWLRFGSNSWHTNSIKLHGEGMELNIIYKLVMKHPTTSLAQVLESFDFGLLAVGYELETGERKDMRSYMFPTITDGVYPLMPNKRADWLNGFISQYNGLREAGRYAKYKNYGHDLSKVKQDLLTGYGAAAAYLKDKDNPEKKFLAQIYEMIWEHIFNDEIEKLEDASKVIVYTDSLDDIMGALE